MEIPSLVHLVDNILKYRNYDYALQTGIEITITYLTNFNIKHISLLSSSHRATTITIIIAVTKHNINNHYHLL